MTTPEWFKDALFYHIYPLGFTGALHSDSTSQHISAPITSVNGDVSIEDVHSAERYQSCSNTENLLLQICTSDFICHLKNLGVSALYIGPLFQSKCHGYDTSDFFCLDSRLGASNEVLRRVIRTYHDHGFRVILDAVYNHVGRDFWAFQDVLQHRAQSKYVSWFYTSLDHSTEQKRCHYNDPFAYEGWAGCYDLVKLNLQNPKVVRHLLSATRFWIDDLGIDGLRLDAADCVPDEFWRLLRKFVSGTWDLASELQYNHKHRDDFLNGTVEAPQHATPDFLLLGEITHGRYRRWACPKSVLQSVTNYALWKSLCSSFRHRHLSELGHTLEHQWRDSRVAIDFDISSGKQSEKHQHPGEFVTPDYLWLYTFLDNHDVDRIASQLPTPFLEVLTILQFVLPGVPSIYYGSEFGFKGVKGKGPTADFALRPKMELSQISQAINSSSCPYNSTSQEWNIYCLYRHLGQLYSHQSLNKLFSRGNYYLFDQSPTFIGFLRFLEDSTGSPFAIVYASLEPITINLPMKVIKKLIGNGQIEFIDLLEYSSTIEFNDDQEIRLHVDYVRCLIGGSQLSDLKNALPIPLWSFSTFQRTFGTAGSNSCPQHPDHTKENMNGLKSSNVSHDQNMVDDLKLTWKSTFRDLNLSDIGQNIRRLFDSKYVRQMIVSIFNDQTIVSYGLIDTAKTLTQHLDLRLDEFNLNDQSSNYFQCGLLMIAVCLPPTPIINSPSHMAASLLEKLKPYSDLLRNGNLQINDLAKNLLVMKRRKSDVRKVAV